jgi:hypothetical protein
VQATSLSAGASLCVVPGRVWRRCRSSWGYIGTSLVSTGSLPRSLALCTEEKARVSIPIVGAEHALDCVLS